jgi:hypothetical protein
LTVEVSVFPLVSARPALAATFQIFGSAGFCARAGAAPEAAQASVIAKARIVRIRIPSTQG